MRVKNEKIRLAGILVLVSLVILASGCIIPSPVVPAGPTQTPSAENPPSSTPENTFVPVTRTNEGIHKIQHIIIIIQENRAFDEYFGTYPGADGIPMKGGIPTVCVPDPRTGQCVRPYHDPRDINYGGPHGQYDSEADINRGKMDGFIRQQQAAVQNICNRTAQPGECTTEFAQLDVMGYHDRREIPNYWTYADQFVLQDRMFESAASWSLPSHLFIVSGWSARCTPGNPMSCVNALQSPQRLIPSERDSGRNSGLCLDRYYVPSVQKQNLVGILSYRGQPARLCR